MYSKPQIFNLALGALLLTRRIIDTDNDPSNECKVLNTHWDAALGSALQEMDLDGTSSFQTLELIDGYVSTNQWNYCYRYPDNCAFLRRIVSCDEKDNRYTYVAKRIAIRNGVKVIYTNEFAATAELIPSDVPISSLSPAAGMVVAYKLALMSAPLITGKGALNLLKDIDQRHKMSLAEAKGMDAQENFQYDEEWIDSEFVAERMS